MNLKITGLNFDVTEAIKNYVSDKLARINRHADNIISVTITLSVEKVNQKAERMRIWQAKICTLKRLNRICTPRLMF